jgi:hypothetical protein
VSAAEKLLVRMRASKVGWGPNDLHTLYKGFEFRCREGARHRIYIHTRYPDIRDTVSRHGELPIGYVQDALKNIDEVLARDGRKPSTKRGGKAQ